MSCVYYVNSNYDNPVTSAYLEHSDKPCQCHVLGNSLLDIDTSQCLMNALLYTEPVVSCMASHQREVDTCLDWTSRTFPS